MRSNNYEVKDIEPLIKDAAGFANMHTQSVRCHMNYGGFDQKTLLVKNGENILIDARILGTEVD